MKKFSIVASLVTLAALGLAGCSHGDLASDGTTDLPVESAANNSEFNALANPDAAAQASADPSVGAVVDTANPSSTVADNSTYSPSSFTDSAPSTSPVNLGASSAGRAR